MGERPPRGRGRPPAGDTSSAGPAGDDARSLLVHQEALRTAAAQAGLVESLRLRTDALIVAAAFVGSLLGGQALADGLELWDVVGLALLLGIGVAAAVVVWPYPSLSALGARQPARPARRRPGPVAPRGQATPRGGAVRRRGRCRADAEPHEHRLPGRAGVPAPGDRRLAARRDAGMKKLAFRGPPPGGRRLNPRSRASASP